MSLTVGRSRNQQETKYAYDPYRAQQEQFLQGAQGQSYGGAYGTFAGLANNPRLDAATKQNIIGQAGEQYDAAADEANRKATTTGNRAGLYNFLGANARQRASGVAQAGRDADLAIAQRKMGAAAGLSNLYGTTSGELSSLAAQRIRDYTHGAGTTGQASVSYGKGGGGGGGGG